MSEFKNTKYSQLHIQLLEPRIMFDGAAIYTASEAIDLLDEQHSSQAQSDQSQIISDVTSITDNLESRKEIVFIDSGVDDYQTIINAIDSSKSIYLIDSNENGFLKMQSILQSQQDVDAVHIIGHASAGQVVLGNSILNTDTINSFSTALQSIGNSLTQNGDLLFYGCNLAQGEQGKLLLQQIGNITQADIAASDDITGQGGDWELEHNYGIVETKDIEVIDYKSFLLQEGISSLSGFVENTGTNLRAGTSDAGTAASASNHTDGNKPFVITYERTVTSGSFTFYNNTSTSTGFEENNSGVQTAGPTITSNTTTVNASSTPMNVYYVYATENSGRNDVRSVTFDGEIKGVWFNMNNIVSYSGVSKSGATYHNDSQHGSSSQNAYSTEKLKWNWGTNITVNSKPSGHKSDWFGVDTDSNTLYVGFNNVNQHGDIIRVFTETSNTAPVARNDVGVIAEDSTLSVSNGANANVSGSYDATGEHSGDVIDTSSTTHYDTDADSDTLTVTAVRLGSSEGSGTAGSVGSALTGTYGQLTLNSNGSYSYAANQSAADALDAGDTVYDYFNYTVSDGTETDTAVITITVLGINDDVTAVNDYGVVTEDATLTVTNGESQNLSGSYDTHDEHSGDISANDTDPDASPTHTITAIRTGSSEGSGTAGSIGSALTGTYGQLTLAADGSYTYVANQDAADALDVGDTVSDYFNYTVSDGTDTDTGVIRIYVLGANDTPVPQNDEGLIAEGSTLTVSNGDNANVSGSYDATGEHTGDVMDTSSSSHSDSDADASASLSITGIRTGRESAAAATFVDSFSVSGEDNPFSPAFNNDGTKMFVVGHGGREVNEYTLSTGFDVSTASFVDSFSVSSQDTSPVGLAFNTDGTKMFVVGNAGDDVNEYTLSTGFDVSTASFVDSFSVSSQETNPYGLAFNTDGTKMFVVGSAGRDVNEYTLSTGFDVSTASFVDSFSVSGQEINPVGLAFNNDGTKMFVVGYAGKDVNEYTLSTGFDVSTASFVDSFSVSDQEIGPYGLAFNTDGTKMFVTGAYGNDVNEYTLTSAFRLANDTGSVGSSLTGAYGTLTMSSNGSYTYAANSSIVGLDAGESVYDYFTYTVSDGSATDTAELKITVIGVGNTAPVARNDVGVIAEDSTLSVSDGTNANVTGSYDATGEHSGDVINTSSTTHYDTDADGDTITVTAIRTGSSEGSGTAGTVGSALTGTYGQLTLNANGSYSYVANQTAADALDAGDSVTDSFNYTISDGSATDIGTITITVLGINDAPAAQNDVGVIAEGSTLTVANSANATLTGDSYDATGENSGDVIDTSSSSHTDSDADASSSLSITHIKLSGGSNSTVASSSSYNSNGTSITGTYGTLTIGADGSYTYAATTDATDALDAGESATDTFVYTLSDGTTITTANITITVLGANDGPVAQNDTGTILEDGTLTVSDGDGTSTVAGASYVDSILTHSLGSASMTSPKDVKFNNDGTKMFVAADGGDAILEYTLSTGYDISTASYDSSFGIWTQDRNPRALAFNNDGTKMFVVGASGQDINEYHLTTGFDVSTASYDSNFSVSNKANSPNGLAFNSDGTKMFVTDEGYDDVVEYTLSTGFDVSTASYDSSFGTQSQDTSSQGLAFSNDGKKMFVAGNTGDDINEYTLSTGFDVSTASFVGNFDVSSQGTSPTGITFNNDGTKMFITDNSGSNGSHSVDEYTLTTPFSLVDVSGEHTGDVIDSSNTSTRDTDVDVETLTVTAVRLGSSEGSGTAGSVGSALTGTYGQLTLNSNGSYTYVANQTAADALDAGDSVTDSFNYIVSDGTATDTAVITITVLGINDTPTAQNDVGVIVEDGTLTVTNGANATLDGSYDATGENSGDLMDTSSSSHSDSDSDASASLSITQIKKNGGSNSSVASGSSYNSSGTQVTGTYGTLTIGADGSYTYAATQDAADVLDVGESATDVFVYTLSDGTATTTANLTITILGANDAPVANNDAGVIVEDGTLTVSNGSNANVTGNYDATGEHSGDVLDTSAASADTDVDVETLTVTAIRTGSSEGSGTAGTVGSALTGTYGQLTLNANGSYSYVANQTAADALDAGDEAVDYFNYTVSDGAATDIAVISIKVLGINDTPVAQNDVGVIAEDSTLTVTNGANANESGGSYNATGEHSGDVINTSSGSHQDSDADASASLTVTQIKKNGGSNSSISSGSSYNSSGTSVTGTYGTLTIGADGSYTYAATADAADGIASGETASDVFVYTLSDGTETTTANITITILGANDSPTAQNDVGVIMEGSTLTVANSANANVSGSYDATGEHSGDVIDTSSSSHTDTDPDTSNTLTITHIKKDGGSNSTVSSSSSYNSSGTAVTGAYGTLTIGADGSYKYVAQSDISGFDAGETLTDTFTYTVSDGTATTTANIVITLLGDDGSSNNAPVAQNDVGVIAEDSTLTVANGANATLSGSYDATGENSGDVMDTSSSGHTDSDADGDAITVTQIRKSGGSDSTVSSSSSYNSSGTSVTGTYGTLVIGADGSYTYAADQSAADDLDAGDSVTDTFIYTISDGTATATATLTITVLGINDAPTAVNDTDSVNEDGTVTKTGAQDDVLTDDSDPDDSATLTVTAIQPSGGSSSNVSSSSSYNSSGTSVTGTYGTLVIGADGSYTYTADQSAADDLDASDTVDDVFTYTVSDGTTTTTATITITVTGVNDTPVAQNDVGVIAEDSTLTVANSANANVSGSYDATGEHSGDVMDTSSSSHTDSDADDSASLTITQIKKDGGSNSSVSSSSSYNSSGTSVTGTYGTLTIGADGSYTYVADQAAADALDAGDSANDVFVYTLSDGTATTTANITISVLGINDDPAAVDDTDTVSEGATVTKTGSQDDVLNDDTDADDSSSLTVTAIQPSGGSSSSVTSSSTYESNGTTVTGTYGTLTIGADGSYTYTANQDAADALDDSESATDVFTYTVSDGTSTDTATITITVNGSNDAPVARDDTGTVEEDATLSVSDGDNANAVSATSYVDGFSVSSQENNPQGIRFNNDGTKMFVIGSAGDDINEYTLSTGFDVSTASFVDSKDISPQETGPSDLAFNSDGTKMFVVGVQGDDVNEYTLSTAFDVSTASFVDSKDISSQDSNPTGLAFNQDGTKMFVAGNAGDDINEYTLSTGFDVSTASFVDSFSVSSQDAQPNGLTFNSDGSKMFVVGNQGNDINEYDLSLGFDVSTASFVGALDVSSQDSAPKAISFNHDGTKLFVLGSTNKSVFEYTLTSPFSLINVDAEHSGDVIDTSNSSSYDTDVDVETLTVTAVRLGSSEGSGTAGTVGSALTGTYGQLTLNANGSYTYVANQSAADDLDAGDVVYDYFNYTVSDGDATDIAVITITVVGINDTPVAVNDTDSVNEDATVTKTGSQDDALYDDTDADDSDSLTVTGIAPSGGSTSTVSEGSTYASGGTTVTGTYGTLIIGADGSYTYTADQSAADDLDLNDTATDVFTYTVSDGANTTTATITITVTGINDDPVAQNDVGVIAEDSTLTVINGANANVSGTYDATGEHSGDVIDTSSSSHTDSDADDSASLTITHVKKSGGSNSTVSSGSSYNSSGTSVTGTYGTLTIGADGSYTYAATESAADDLDVGDEVSDVFTYTLSDGTETTTANITITVIGINDTPTAVNDTDSVTEDERVTKRGTQDDVLNDDTDSDDSASLVVTNISHTNGNSDTVSSSTTFANGTTVVGTYGTLTIGANGSYTYIADQDAADSIADGSSETDVFTYTVSDGNGGTDTATLTITINGADNEVVAVTDTGAVDASSTLSKSVTSAGLLSNDTDNGSAALSVGESSVTTIRTGKENRSGTSGTIGSTLVGTYGTLTLNSDGTYTYAATTAAADALAPAETAVDYFTYTISDGSSTDTAELRITVTGINNAPTSTSPPQVNAVENQKIIIQSKTFFDDPDPKNNTFGQLTYTTGGLPAGLSINDQGKIDGRLPEGTYTFTVTATDGGNLSSQQTFTIVVGKPGKPGEKPPKPIRINFKTIDDAVERQVVVFREEAPKRANAQMETLEVGSSLESIVKDYTFNGGMKVIDVAVEDLNLKENGFNLSDGGNIGIQEDTILGFAIGDDYRLNVKQYTGALEDGSALPNWVKVDPATGQTIVQFPDNIFSINVKVIAIDKDSTTREINVTLDKNSVRQDQSLKRDLKPFVDRSTSLKSEVTVDDRGQVFIEASNDGERDINRTQNLNSSNVPNTTDDILSTLQYDVIEKEGDLFRIKISEDTRNDSTKYSLRFSNQIDGPQGQLPSWILIDRNTGEIQARPPSGIDSIELEVLAEDKDGNVRSLEIDLDFTQDDLSLNIENLQLDEKIVEFASLQDQINLEFDGYENYGDKLTKASS